MSDTYPQVHITTADGKVVYWPANDMTRLAPGVVCEIAGRVKEFRAVLKKHKEELPPEVYRVLQMLARPIDHEEAWFSGKSITVHNAIKDIAESRGSICTASGKTISIANIATETIHIEDLAHSLSRICRFNGHVLEFYCVAAHSVHVSEFLQKKGHSPYVQLIGLLHDMAEGIIGDIISPIKDLVPGIKELENIILDRAYQCLGIPKPDETTTYIVKDADNQVFLAEKHYLLHSAAQTNVVEPVIKATVPGEYSNKFLETYYELRSQIKA